jgi:hypothetical protein
MFLCVFTWSLDERDAVSFTGKHVPNAVNSENAAAQVVVQSALIFDFLHQRRTVLLELTHDVTRMFFRSLRAAACRNVRRERSRSA